MTSGRAGVIGQMRTLFRMGSLGGLSDGQLLERFISGQEEVAEDAFAALVERHGPMVLNLCRSILRDHHDAQDAFQAVFLVLARKASAIGRKDSLGNWLYGVAYRTALKARTSAARRRRHEQRSAGMVPEGFIPDTDGHESRAVLCEEISRLPEKYRAPVVLCHLEGMSREMAAAQLRCPANTVGVRLMRARERLRTRLTRRGLVFPATLLAAGLRPGSATAAAPPALVDATIRTAMRCVAGRTTASGAASTFVVTLAEGVLKTMILTNLKTAVLGALAIGIVTTGGGLLVSRETETQPQRTKIGAGEHPGSLASMGPIPPQDGPERRQDQQSEVDEALTRLVSGRIVRVESIGKDCMVLEYLPDWAHGDVDNIGVASNDGGVRTLIDWPDVTLRDADSPGRQYLVALYSRKTTSHGPAGPIHAFRLLEDWPERTSWKMQPTYDPEPAASFKFVSGEGWKLFDVTSVVRAQVKSGRKGHGLVLRFLSEDRSSQKGNWSGYEFVSREGAGEWSHRRPMLLVVEPTK
jgi:RNA polymerase sigma factor (sigma-70 family)